MAEHHGERRRIEGNFHQGWPVAALIMALTIGCFVGAFVIHRATYHSPNDVTVPSNAPGVPAER